MKFSNKYIPELTADGSWTMRSSEIDECFHSAIGAQKEAELLYLAPSVSKITSSLKEKKVCILDVGLGLGYNALTFIDWWHKSNHLTTTKTKLVSLEKDFDLIKTLVAGSGEWQKNWTKDWKSYLNLIKKKESGELFAHYEIKCNSFSWIILAGDAKQADLGAWKFDIIWQDAFSPRKNPDLWSADWFDKLKKSASPDAHLFTYSVAGTVKEALTTSGWQYEKIKRNDSLHKKQWLKAYISKT